MALNQPNPNGQTTSANSAPVVLASDQSSIAVKDSYLAQTITFASTGTQNGASYDLNTNGFRYISIHVTTIGTGSNYIFQTSNDNTNWVSQNLTLSTSNLSTPSSQANTNSTMWAGPVFGRYFRIQCTGQTAGTTTLNVVYSKEAITPLSIGGQVSINGTNTVRQVASTSSSSLLVAKVLSAANTTPVSVKTSIGQIYGWQLVNNATTTRFLRIYNVSAAPTPGTTVPYFVLPLPPGGGAVMAVNDLGIPFSTGFYYIVTSGSADLDTTAGAAADVVGTFWYI